MLKKMTIKTKYGSFECLFKPEKDMGGYIVEVKGLQGALSWGKNMTEAKKMIVEAIEGSIKAHIILEAEQEGFVRVRHHKSALKVA